MSESRRPISVFTSYSHHDRAFAGRLSKSLESKGIDVWYDQIEVQPGDSLVEKLDDAVTSTDAILLVVSKNAYKSKWVTYEFRAILTRRPSSEQTSPIIPLRIDDSELPFDLSGHVSIDFRHDYEAGLSTLVDALRGMFPGAERYIPDRLDLPELTINPMLVRTPITERVQRHLASDKVPPITFLSGGPGSGKTTIANVAARESVQQGVFARAIYINLSQHQTQEDVLEELQQRLATVEPLPLVLQREKILIVLDEFDSLPSASAIGVFNSIRHVLQHGGNSHVLVIARSTALATPQLSLDMPKVTIFEVPLLSYAEMNDFIRKYAESTEGLDAEAVISSIGNRPDLHEACMNPALLHMFLSRWPETGEPIADLHSYLESLADTLDADAKRVLFDMSHFDAPVSVRTISTITGQKDMNRTRQALDRLVASGLLTCADDRYYFAHRLIKELAHQSSRRETALGPGGKLYITVDPTLMDKEDVVELLDTLNQIYSHLGGEEIIIREDELGKFAAAEVLV